ncbi:MAG: DUF4412 domain-containing protein [Bacteroidales bacterium]
MKSIIKLYMLIFVSFISLNSFAGDKDFQGVIVYNITYPESNLDAQTMAMMPTTMKMTVKGTMNKVEISMAMGTTIMIFDAATDKGTTLMQMMGQKFAIPMDKESIEEEAKNIDSVNVQITDETKDIVGYSCKKAVVTSIIDGKKYELIAWFTEELGDGSTNALDPLYEDIKGVLMEFSTIASGMTMKMEVVKVEKKKVSEKEFEIPEGYKEITTDQLQNMFGGGY